jgi:eukaryotic-like serine/threonine-protein kinase
MQVIAGRYELGREIGRGGMGAVWLGRDTVLGRVVALKRVGLMPGAESPDLQRAEREARLAARLNHPHVVAVFDLVEDGGETWLVMEYVEGATLSALVQRDGPLALDDAALLLRQAADALAAAHAAGIVHRDVKPSNMLVSPAAQVKLTDFGIARAQADATLTRTGLVTGSPAYLAPEVASGGTATPASDVWSWGATLFHALAGHPPYDVSDNVMGALYAIVHDEPPRLDDAGWLAPVLEHTMAHEIGDRWSMAQLRDFLDQRPEVASHPSPVVVDEATRTLDATPDEEPVAVPPVAWETQALEAPPPPGVRRRSPWPWVAALVALAALAVIGYSALTAGGGGPAATHSGPRSREPSRSSTTSSAGTTNPAATKARAMKRFLETYLSTVTSDRHTAWEMLTPGYQEASDNYGAYNGFWRTIASATPSDITADPAAMTVTYDVAYVRTDGSRTTEHHTLQLVRDGSTYLISNQLS